MHEIDFLKVAGGEKSGDAIAMRFTRPDTDQLAHVVIDAGFKENGDELVALINKYYGVSAIELAILTHPDGDHIGGMGQVIRGLDVELLWLHDIGAHGGSSLPAAKAVKDLIGVAHAHSTEVRQPWAGAELFGGALRVLGPTKSYYKQLVTEQVLEHQGKTASRCSSPALLEAARSWGERFIASLPVEIPFDDDGGTNPRNNSSIITLIDLPDARALLTADAGVNALDAAWQQLDPTDRAAPTFIQMPHHGSRHNTSTDLLNTIVGPPAAAGSRGTAVVSVSKDAPKHPSPRVFNAFLNRGYNAQSTAEWSVCHRSADAPPRADYSPAAPLPPMDPSLED